MFPSPIICNQLTFQVLSIIIITVSGRIQSREYQKNVDGDIVVKTAYEVSISRISTDDAECGATSPEECASDER